MPNYYIFNDPYYCVFKLISLYLSRQEIFHELEDTPTLCLGLEHRTFLYQPTTTHDLWSILSELLFQKLRYAPQIHEAALRMKFEETNYYHFSKLKKRQLTKGHRQNEKLRKQYLQSLKSAHKHNGNTHDLELVASVLKFSYTMIGLDANGNFFWKESILISTDSEQPPVKLALFVKLKRNKETNWYSMRETEIYWPKEAEVYGSWALSEDTVPHRELYFRSQPCSSSHFWKLHHNMASNERSQWEIIRKCHDN